MNIDNKFKDVEREMIRLNKAAKDHNIGAILVFYEQDKEGLPVRPASCTLTSTASDPITIGLLNEAIAVLLRKMGGKN